MFKQQTPSMDAWMQEAKKDKKAAACGMFLCHNGVVRETPKAEVREHKKGLKPVTGLLFDYDVEKTKKAVEETKKMPGIHYVRVWLNQGKLTVGDDIMLVLIGGDIRPNVIAALETLVGNLKNNCVTEKELYD